MLPVLFTLSIPAAWSKPLLALAVLAVALARAWSFRRRPAEEGRERPGWGAALWDDKLTLAMLAAGAAAVWRAGLLDPHLSLPLHTYGLMIASGFVAAIWLPPRQAAPQP